MPTDKPDTILEKTVPISVEALKEAISLKCANCYGAMAFANALCGGRTDAWLLCHTYPLEKLLEEAEARNLDLSDLKSAIDDVPVQETLYYKRAKNLITESEFRAAFAKWQRGET